MKRLVLGLMTLAAACTTTGDEVPDPAPKAGAIEWGQPATPPETVPRPDTEAEKAEPSAVLNILEGELNRHMTALAKKAGTTPYFISYSVTETWSSGVESSQGTITGQRDGRIRWLDVEVRVGDYALDNTNRNRGGGGGFTSRRVPLDDDPDVLRRTLWRATDAAFRSAEESFIRVQTNDQVSVEEEDDSGDFTKETPEVFIEAPLDPGADAAFWADKVRAWSKPFRGQSALLGSNVGLRSVTTNIYMVNSEGTKLQFGDRRIHLTLQAQAQAEDGMELIRHESAFAREPSQLPSDGDIDALVKDITADLVALREAPVVEPWVGPVILSGRAAGVFFHEIFGHRIEGHRQRDERSGQTFTRDLGQEILPPFLSVSDDPTLYAYEDDLLSGHYRFDDEGVRGQRVDLIEDGVLRTFLTSRLPLKTVGNSNGHGRKQVGRQAVARQGNLLVTPSRTVSIETLRKMLLDELARQGKDFGYLFEDISGGFTNTQRFSPQAFKVTPLMVYRIYADGRPDELVRGVDIAGTPKTVFKKIIAAADDYQVFNGFCGAESGWVPVSAASPSLLLSEVEIEKKLKSNERGPILSPPPMEDAR